MLGELHSSGTTRLLVLLVNEMANLGRKVLVPWSDIYRVSFPQYQHVMTLYFIV